MPFSEGIVRAGKRLERPSERNSASDFPEFAEGFETGLS